MPLEEETISVYNIVYKRRGDLEKNNCHIVIVDVTCTEPVRIINIYRSFHPPDGSSQSSFFAKQLEIIKNAICRNCFVMGDFNLEGGNNLRPDYQNKLLLNTLKNFTSENNLYQVVNFSTWSRTINGNKKESMLDHVYLNNFGVFNSVYFENPVFGDHVLVVVELALREIKTPNKSSLRGHSLIM